MFENIFNNRTVVEKRGDTVPGSELAFAGRKMERQAMRWVAVLRRGMGLSIDSLAAQSSVPRSWLGAIESGIGGKNLLKDPAMLERVAVVLGQPASSWRRLLDFAPTEVAHKPQLDNPQSFEPGEYGFRAIKKSRSGLGSVLNRPGHEPWNPDAQRGAPIRKSASFEYMPLKKRVQKAGGEEQRYTLGVAYPADDVDAHGETATAEEVEKAAWQFLQKPDIGVMHQNGSGGAGTVVESYIHRGDDWDMGGEIVKSGDWMLGVVWEPEAWNLIKSGGVTGYSIQGLARNAGVST